jgi:hypothetical protein
MRSCELSIVPYDEQLALPVLPVMPTVCLMILQETLTGSAMAALVKDCLILGAVCFSIYGSLAASIEDQVDLILENGDVEFLNITTTSHQNESIEDTAHFVVNAAYRATDQFRCLVIYDHRVEGCDLLLQEVKKLCLSVNC